MSALTEKNLFSPQQQVLDVLTADQEYISQSSDTVVYVIVGLSGIGKSQVVTELAGLLPQHSINDETGEAVFTVGNAQLLIRQITLSASLFNETGTIDAADLNDLHHETIIIPQRTLSVLEALSLIQGLDRRGFITDEQYDRYTLGIPKLIFGAERCEHISQIVKITSNYLGNMLRELDPALLPQAIAFIEQHFLASGRKIPQEVIRALKGVTDEEQPYTSQLQDYASYLADPHSHHLHIETIVTALENMDSHSSRHYRQSFERIKEIPLKTYTLTAWLDITPEMAEIIREEMNTFEPNFNRPELGQVGLYLDMMKLSRQGMFFRSQSVFAGSATKCIFAIRVGDEETGEILTNGYDERILITVGGKLVNMSFNGSSEDGSRRGKPNLVIKVYDHEVYAPTEVMMTQEAVLQQFGVNYQVSRSDGNLYDYDPERTVPFQAVVSAEDLRQQRRAAHNEKNKKKKKKR